MRDASHVLGQASSPTCTVYADMTVTRSKVKVTDHLNFRHLNARFSNSFLGQVSLQFILHGMSIFHDIQMATFITSVLRKDTVIWLGTLVVLHVLCMLM